MSSKILKKQISRLRNSQIEINIVIQLLTFLKKFFSFNKIVKISFIKWIFLFDLE